MHSRNKKKTISCKEYKLFYLIVSHYNCYLNYVNLYTNIFRAIPQTNN